ncbi:MAG: hypothetical protein VYC31_06915 [Pseudomonadota bacterium]|nr:hypothetical protein [Pseudomonadota bacterium]
MEIKKFKRHLARRFAAEMPATGADLNGHLQPDGLEETRPPKEGEEMAFFYFVAFIPPTDTGGWSIAQPTGNRRRGT